MQIRAPLPGEYAALALLLDGPQHGYEMARAFAEEGLEEVCPVEQSLLYTYLRNLEQRQLIAWAEERVGLRPPRKVFHLTAEGHRTIEEWLRQPVERMREVRLEFLIKLYFLHRLSPPDELELLRQQIAVCEAYGERLRQRVAVTNGFANLVARSKETAAEGALSWLRSYAWELEHTVRREP